MRKFILTPLIAILLSFGLTFNSTAQDLMITGVFDGPLTGGSPKVLELYAVNDIADLSAYTVKNQTNANTTWGADFTLSGSAVAGDFVYVVYNATPGDFNTYFENTITALESSVLNLNGDDRLGLFDGTDALVDIYGAVDTDGTGTTWEWLDGWAYRNIGSSASATFTESEWTFSGINVTDGETLNSSAATPFPIGTFTLTTGPCGADQSELFLTTSGGSYSSEKWVDITTEVNGAGTVIWAQGDGSYGNGAGLLTDESVCVDNGVTFYINAYDKYADGWDGTTYELKDQYGIVVANNGGVSPNDGVNNDVDSNWEERALEIESSESFSYTPPSCPPPTDLALDSNTADEATFSWTENGSTSNWNLIYGAPGFDPLTEGTTVAADANPYTITGLTPETEYDVYVEADCGAGDLSTLDGPVNFTTDIWIELDLTGDDITLTWNAPVGTFDAGIIINSAPYNTDGGFFLVQLYDESNNLVTFADVFNEFSIGALQYHSGTSNRIFADFTATQQSGIWGTAAVSDNAAAGGSLRGTSLDGSLFYGVMVDGTVGTVGAVLPGTGSDTKTIAYTIADAVYGTYTLKADYYVPFRPGDVSSPGFYTIAELEGLTPLASISREIDLGCAPVTSFPFTEMFEDVVPPDCWEEVRTPSSSSGWSSNTNGVTGNCARFNSWSNSNGNISELSTPTLDISTLSNPIFKFTYKNPTGGDFSVLLSTDNGATYPNTLFSGLTGTSDWTEMSVDIAPYIGSEVKIAFVGTSNYGSGDAYIYLDDVTVRELSSEADILTFELTEQTAPATIDAGALTVDIEVGGATDVTALAPTITVSNGASISPASGVAQDFTNPVTYSVTAEDGTEKLWDVTVTPATTLSSENDILTFELTEQTGPATIGAGTVDIEVTWNTDVTSLTPTITVSPLATISPETGVAQDFTNPVTYTVTAEDATEQPWTVTVTKEPTPPGLTCESAFNYGAVNDPAQTGAIASYESVWYYVTLTEMLADVSFSLCASDFDTKIEVWNDCGDAAYAYYNDDACGTRSQVIAETLDAGTYYVKVYGYSSSSGNYELEITGTNCASPTGVTATDILSDAATISWTTGLTETAWNLKVSDVSIDPTLDAGNIFDGVVNTTPEQALTGLAESTDYYVYVQADCGADWTTEYIFTTAAGCPQPANLTANVGVDFAELDWDAFGGTEWNIKISDVSIDPSVDAGNIEDVSATTTKPYTTSVTLDPNTTYYFYVQTSCGSAWSDEAMFTTNCETISSFPYFEGFETEWAPECWSNSLWTLSTYGSPYEGDEFAYTNEAGSQLITPAFTLPAIADNMILEFFYRAESSSYPQDLNVNLSTDGVNFTESVAAFSGMTNTDYMSLQYDLSAYAGQTIWVRFEGESGTGGLSYGALIDNFTIREVSSEADFLTYSIPEQTSAADINYTANTIAVEVGNGTDLTTLVADYTVSSGASASIGTTPQESGVSINDFSSPVTYSVTAEDGVTVNNWVVTVTEAPINAETDILTYSFPEETSAATIDATENTVDIEVAWNADVTALVADFTLSYGATATVAGTDQESGVTANDFTDPVVYTVTAEDGSTTEDWTITVTVQATPAGATCADPFDYGTINDPEVINNIDSYGRELWYTFTIDQPFMDIQVSTCASVYDTKVYVYDACGGNELAYDDDAPSDFCDVDNNQSLAEIDFLEAGTYYVLITTYSTSTDISDPTTGLYITGTADYITPYADNTTLTLTPETQNVATGDDATGVMEVVYPTTVSTDMPVDMMTDAMIDLSELTAGAVVELFNGATSLGTYTVTGGETVWASEAFTGVNRVPASMTEGQSLNWDVVISGLADGTYNVSATLYLGLDADLTAETDITEVATDAMVINVAAPFIDLALINPEGGMYDCGLEDPVNVPVEIENVGNTTIATGEIITFYVDVNGTNELEEEITLAEDLLPGETLSMETTSTLDFTALGTYNWEAIIDYTGDTDPNNNFTTGYLVHFNQDIEFVGAVNDTITIDATDWPYTIETNLTLSTDSVLVSTYEWEFDGSTETSLTINDEGWYILHVTTEFCETMDSVFVLAYNGIDVNANNEFAIYPNPTHGQFMLEMNLVEKQDVVISIFNSNGQLVREFKFNDIDQFAREINMTDEAEGLYSIRINAGGKLYNRQVVIR